MRKAVSPLLATIILVAITIAIGVLVYQLVYSSVGVAGQVAQVQITSASIIQPTSGSEVLTMEVKNTGDHPFNVDSLSLLIDGESGSAADQTSVVVSS